MFTCLTKVGLNALNLQKAILDLVAMKGSAGRPGSVVVGYLTVFTLKIVLMIEMTVSYGATLNHLVSAFVATKEFFMEALSAFGQAWQAGTFLRGPGWFVRPMREQR